MLSFTGFPGIVSAFTRTIYSYFAALYRAPRMDLAGLQKGAESWDNGTYGTSAAHNNHSFLVVSVCHCCMCVHVCVRILFANAGHLIYQGLIYLEAIYNNPVGHVFADFLIKTLAGTSLSGQAPCASTSCTRMRTHTHTNTNKHTQTLDQFQAATCAYAVSCFVGMV